MKEKIYNATMELINETIQKSRGRLAMFEGFDKKLDQVCKYVSEFEDKVDLEDIFIEIDEEIRVLSVCVLCDELILQHGRSDSFFDLIKLADSFSFSKEKEDTLKISLNFYHVWRLADE